MSEYKGRVSPVVIAIVVIFFIGLGTLCFVESRQNSYTSRVGNRLKTAIKSLGPRFNNVRILYSYGGGILITQGRPSVVTGNVRNKLDLEMLKKTVNEVCAELKYDKKIVVGVKIVSEGTDKK